MREKNGILDPRDLPKGYKPGDTITRKSGLLPDEPEPTTEKPGYFSRVGDFFKNLFSWAEVDDIPELPAELTEENDGDDVDG